MSSTLHELLLLSGTRVLPILAASNLGFYFIYKKSGMMTWVDVAWAFNHALAGGYFFYINQAYKSAEGIVYMTLLLSWSLRLGSHLLKRCFDSHSDPRYEMIAKKYKANKSIVNLFQFEFQAILVTLTSIPLFFVFRGLSPKLALDWRSISGISMIILGILGEWRADSELEAFKKNNSEKKENEKEKPICNKGLWKYSRHPNLFFDLMTWGGFTVLGLRVKDNITYLATLGPVFLYLIMDLLSTRVTEKYMSSSRPNWKEHVKNTNKYLPFLKI